MIEDGHVYTQEFLIINDAWFNDLPDIYQHIILQGAERAGYVGDRAARVAEEKGIEVLSKQMEIYTPTMDEIPMFREATQDRVLEFIKKDIDNPEWIEKILEAAKLADEKIGFTE
jgi:TRAP-type C4-dicarboxylate transport system substrate-binding protein